MRDQKRRLISAFAALSLAVAIPTVTTLATSAGAAVCSTASEVPGSNFEIDTNANLAVNGASPCIDWLAAGSGNAMRTGVITHPDKLSGSGDDAFGGGTSEDDANPKIVAGSIPPNKSDLKVFGLYQETAGTAKFLELFWSRVQNPSGTTNMDFELNQKFCDLSATPTNCANNNVPTPETPLRTVGDKLITYDLANGGTVPSISIRTWGGSSWGAATVISGAGGTALGAVNTSTLAATATGGIGSQDPITFGEAAISFAALFPNNGTCGTFGGAYLKSRSSTSFNSEIKDFISPQKVTISNCSTLVTAASGATIGGAIHDTATISGATTGATGSITFKLYSDSGCANLVTTLGPVTVNGNGDYGSGDYTPTAVGTYYWIASYTGDLNNSPSAGKCGDSGESSTVTQAEPQISTTAAGPVTIGSAISDSATLSGASTAPIAGGTITFHLYSDSLCGTEINTGLLAKTVSGNGSYGSGDYTPGTVGTYYWVASYSGDTNNKAATGACGDSGESSVVNQVQPQISTTAAGPVTIGSPISDSATLSGGSTTPTVGGTITFHLYSDSACGTEINTGLTAKTVSGNGSYGSGNYTPTAVGTYYWIATYSGDTNNKAASGTCGDAGESSVVNKAPSGIDTSQTITPQDSTTISATAGGTPTGTVTFKLFGPNNSTCDPLGAAAVYTESVGLTNGAAGTSNGTFSVTTASASIYKWLVVYGGDTKHDGATSACGTEAFTLTIKNT